MARAAVKAKQQAQKKAAQAAKAALASGPAAARCRRQSEPAALLHPDCAGRRSWSTSSSRCSSAITFAFLGVGSGTNGGLDQLFSGLNIFSSGGTSVSKAQKEIKDHPNSAKGYRDLATAYEGKGDTVNAISALQQYTVQKPKDAAAWSELGGLQFTQAQNYLSAYQAASNARQLAAPSTRVPADGQARAGDRHESDRAGGGIAGRRDAARPPARTQLAYTNAVASYQKAASSSRTTRTPGSSSRRAPSRRATTTTAVKGYKHYLKLNPNSSSAAQIRQLIKQLSPAAVWLDSPRHRAGGTR